MGTNVLSTVGLGLEFEPVFFARADEGLVLGWFVSTNSPLGSMSGRGVRELTGGISD